MPRNLKEQETKFKESGYTINPIFEYDNEANTTKYLLGFKMEDDPELFDVAIKILDAFINEYTTEEQFRDLEGDLISQQETEDFFNDYIKELDLQEFLTLKSTPHAIAQTAINHCSGKRSKIII